MMRFYDAFRKSLSIDNRKNIKKATTITLFLLIIITNNILAKENKNNSCNNTEPIALNSWTESQGQEKNNYDYFEITIPENGIIAIETIVDSLAVGFHETLLLDHNCSATHTTVTHGQRARVIDPGTYFIAVHTAGNQAPYRLQVGFNSWYEAPLHALVFDLQGQSRLERLAQDGQNKDGADDADRIEEDMDEVEPLYGGDKNLAHKNGEDDADRIEEDMDEVEPFHGGGVTLAFLSTGQGQNQKDGEDDADRIEEDMDEVEPLYGGDKNLAQKDGEDDADRIEEDMDEVEPRAGKGLSPGIRPAGIFVIPGEDSSGSMEPYLFALHSGDNTALLLANQAIHIEGYFFDTCAMSPGDDFGDSFGCSHDLVLGQRLNAQLRHNDIHQDLDTFSFLVRERGRYALQTESDIATRITLFDSQGRALTSATGDDSWRGRASTTALITQVLEPGQYFLRVGGQHGVEGHYTVLSAVYPTSGAFTGPVTGN